MSGFLRRTFEPRPAWSAAHLVEAAALAIAEPPTVPFAVPVVPLARGRHRAHRKARVVIGECIPPASGSR